MELTRIAKRSFKVISRGQIRGIVQRIPTGRRWIYFDLEGCGIRRDGLEFKSLRDLDGFVALSPTRSH